MRFDLQLIDRVARLTQRDREGQPARPITFDAGTDLPYRTAQSAVDATVHILVKRLNASTASELGKYLADGRIELKIHGHRREIDVAAMHLYVAYGLPMDRIPAVLGSDGVRDACVYDTYQFGSDQQIVLGVAALLQQWTESVRADDAETRRATATAEKIRKKLAIRSDGSLEPVRVGITGVTGAGKSSFVNAILGRPLLPTAAGITTGVLTEVTWAPSVKDEGFSVEWLPLDLLKSRQQSLEAEWSRLLTSEQNAARKSKIADIERARQCWGTGQQTLLLLHLPRYASLGADSLCAGVRRVIVRVHHPVLRHVTFVDTPGLRDPDQLRRKIAVDAVSELDAWAYLAQGADKGSSSVIEDWAELRDQAHNDAGVLVLTKLDQCFGSVAEVLRDRESVYRQYGWKEANEYCAASGPATVGATGDWPGATLGMLPGFVSFLCAQSSGLKDAFPAVFQNLYQACLLRERDSTWRRMVVDYILDASGVPACARVIGTKVAESGLRRRRESGLADLRGEVEAARARIHSIWEQEKRNLDTCSNLEALVVERERMEAERVATSTQLTRAAQAIDGAEHELLGKIEAKVADALAPNAPEPFGAPTHNFRLPP